MFNRIHMHTPATCSYSTWSMMLSLLLLFSCQKEDQKPLAYERLSSVVGSEGKTITFFEDTRNSGKNIPIALYPTLIFQAHTFETPSILTLDAQKMSFNTLPANLVAISANSCKWTILSSNPVATKPIQVIIPFEQPDSTLWLENYQHFLKVYKLPKDALPTNPANWQQVDPITLDTSRHTMTASIDNFEYGYCILFDEIRRSDNIVLSTQGSVNTIQTGVATDYFSSRNANSRGFYYRHGISQYYYEGFWNDEFTIHFSFEGNTTGTYQGNQIKVAYQFRKNAQAKWIGFHATPNTAITITSYGKLGEWIQGKIAGDLANTNGDTLTFTMDFKLIRTR